VPPAFSAVKVTGRRAYALARRGWAVELTPRRVRIDSIEIDAFDYPRLDLLIRCGKGTYIRSLARDLGERLGCGAYIESLRRTAVGPFAAVAGLSLEVDTATARAQLLPLTSAVTELPHLTLGEREVSCLRHGQSVALPLSHPESDREFAVFDEVGDFLGVAEWNADKRRLRPVKMLSR